MSFYPQLITGALSQFPITKRRQTRTVINRLADGSSVRLVDTLGCLSPAGSSNMLALPTPNWPRYSNSSPCARDL